MKASTVMTIALVLALIGIILMAVGFAMRAERLLSIILSVLGILCLGASSGLAGVVKDAGKKGDKGVG